MMTSGTQQTGLTRNQKFYGASLVLIGMMSWPLAFGLGKMLFFKNLSQALTMVCYLVFCRGVLLYFVGQKLMYNRGQYTPFKEVLKHPDAKSSIMLGCIGILAAISSFMAVLYIGITELIIIVLMAPFLVNIGRPFFLNQPFKINALISTALALVGALIAMDVDNKTAIALTNGFGLAFLGTVFMATYILVGHKYTQRNRTLGISLAGIANMIMAVVVLIAGNIAGITNAYVPDFMYMVWQDYAVAFIVIVLTIKGLVVGETGFRAISAVLGSMVLYLELFWATAIDHMIFDIPHTGPIYVGMVIIMLAAVFDMYSNRKSGKLFS